MEQDTTRRDFMIPALNVMLRVPPLFIMDGILNFSSDLFILEYLGLPHNNLFWILFWVLIFALCFVAGLTIFLLGITQLITVYNYILLCGILALSYWRNNLYIDSEVNTNYQENGTLYYIFVENLSKITGNLIIQISCAIACNTLREVHWTRIEKYTNIIKPAMDSLTFLSFLLPTLCRVLTFTPEVLQTVVLLSLVLPLLEFLVKIYVKLRLTYSFVRHTLLISKYMIKNFGLMTFIEAQWQRLQVPLVLKTFWLILMSTYATYFTIQTWSSLTVNNDLNEADTSIENKIETPILNMYILYDIFTKLLIRSCETIIAILGFTSSVSFLMHHLGVLLANFIGSTNEEDKSMGTVSAVLFFILSLQTGLTGLEPEKRLIRLYKNFCLLSTAILHFIHGMLNPLLEQLSAMGYQSPRKHYRVLFVCLLLIVIPISFLLVLWSYNELSTWLLAVTAFSIEVILKVVVSLLIYTLFMIDAHSDGYWDKLDDHIYYIRGAGACMEFVFGIFLLCNGGYIMLFESGGMIRAVMMCVHAYFNIWVQAKEGWKKFMRRRTAVDKINILPEINCEELAARGKENELCAICFQELMVARVTRCNHYFHANCLRKWLYQQDKCPLCHEDINLVDKTDANTQEQNSNHINENNVNQNVELEHFMHEHVD